jgi:hypothetical protein
VSCHSHGMHWPSNVAASGLHYNTSPHQHQHVIAGTKVLSLTCAGSGRRVSTTEQEAIRQQQQQLFLLLTPPSRQMARQGMVVMTQGPLVVVVRQTHPSRIALRSRGVKVQVQVGVGVPGRVCQGGL